MTDSQHPIRLAEEPLTDRHKLGWGLAALVVAGNMIGSGVYLLPVSLAAVGSSSLIGWLVAGVGAVTLALVFGALGRLHPDADGLPGFAERGLGRFFGFQTALAFWTACLVGNVAIAVAATGYLGFFWPMLKDPVAATFCNLGIIWLARTATLSTSRISSFSSDDGLYLLTPTMTSSPISTRACLAAAAFSISSLGMPLSTALVMPPSSSTSPIIFHAWSTNSAVNAST